MTTKSRLSEILRKYENELLTDWMREQAESESRFQNVSERELREQCAEFLRLLQEATQANHDGDINGSNWLPVRELLGGISRSRSAQGATPSQTATFVFSFKKPLFTRLSNEVRDDAQVLADETWAATELLDKLGLYTTEIYQKSRDEIISRQQQEMMELSTPVVKLWEGILALPLIGTLR